MTGRIDVHSHLLPAVDDGCKTLEESLACARVLVENGYTHSFCTPHIWKSFPANNVSNIPRMTAALQKELDANRIPLQLIPGGEINIQPEIFETVEAEVVTFAMHNRFCLVDMWAEKLPEFFTTNVKWLQSLGLTVILAHPERMRAVQDDPGLADYFTKLGVLLQGNLQCFGDPPHTRTRQTAEQFLEENRYFVIGSDLHGIESLPIRLAGLRRLSESLNPKRLRELTWEHPLKLLPSAPNP
jgi:protein-tyrosine phosphatase